MSHADFVHLRVHSAYSLSEGATTAKKIPVLAREAQMPAVAITDTARRLATTETNQHRDHQAKALSLMF
jgi:DNA polymerase III subunit alpha